MRKIEYLTAYLHYEVSVFNKNWKKPLTLGINPCEIGVVDVEYVRNDSECKLCLKPLEKSIDLDKLSYNETIKLIKDYYDVFGLIEKGLAVNLNFLEL